MHKKSDTQPDQPVYMTNVQYVPFLVKDFRVNQPNVVGFGVRGPEFGVKSRVLHTMFDHPFLYLTLWYCFAGKALRGVNTILPILATTPTTLTRLGPLVVRLPVWLSVYLFL